MNQSKIVVLGASENPLRPSYSATKLLNNKGFEVYAMATQKGKIDNVEIHDFSEKIEEAETITLFLNSTRQKKYYDYILSLHPKRIIFNPGSENPELEELARQHKITVIKGCTIALLMSGLW